MENNTDQSVFDFGRGPVPAHRHSNGGGWVADTAVVAERAFVGPRAQVEGGTIRGGTIRGGTIRGGTIEGGTIEGGTIWGGTIRGGTIRGGTIQGGTIRGGTIRGGTIQGGTIRGGTIRGGTIRGGTIRGGTIWGGTIWGGTIWGGTIWGDRDVLTIGPVGSENQHATLVRHTNSGAGHILTIGCWTNGTIDRLAAEVQERCPDRADEYAEIELILRRRLAEWGDVENAS